MKLKARHAAVGAWDSPTEVRNQHCVETTWKVLLSGDWRDGTEVRRPSYASRGPGLNFHHMYGFSQLSMSSPRDLTVSSGT